MLRSKPLEFPSAHSKPIIYPRGSLPFNVKIHLISTTRSKRFGPFQRVILILAFVISALTLLLPHSRRYFLWSAAIDQDDTLEKSIAFDVVDKSLTPDVPQDAAFPVAHDHSYFPPGFVDVMHFEGGSLAAVLPVTTDTIKRLQQILDPLFSDHSHVSVIGLVCKVELLPTLQALLEPIAGETYMDIISATWQEGSSESSAVMKLASEMATEYILIMSSEGILLLDQDSQTQLLSPPLLLDAVSGFCGGQRKRSTDRASCVYPGHQPQNATFLLPPFVLPSSRIHGLNFTRNLDIELWMELDVAFGEAYSGALVQETGYSVNKIWCQKQCLRNGITLDDSALDECLVASKDAELKQHQPTALDAANSSSLAIILPTVEDLQYFLAAACKFIHYSISVHVLILSPAANEKQQHDNPFPWLHDHLSSNVCEISYSALHSSSNEHANTEAVTFWLKSANETMSTIIFGAPEDSNSFLEAELRNQAIYGTNLIKVPQASLPFCDWIGSLSLSELRHWNTPEIEITVITDDRPRSLVRLLRSLRNAHYFGDSVNLRINMEQTADSQTRKYIEDFQWEHGQVFIHHRVVHAGLLTAIVESWYPRSNNSYGVLLEDDVEVSLLYYAWTKMALLRYRYGTPENRSPSLFGISLYQQKQTELRPEGRRPFSAQTLFDTYGLYYRDSPYVSQVPCSWGAVYFPEHWREFHSYLMIRFSEAWLPVSRHVVPHVRSNRWAKSWKRFFIELVFLRGYVMLYPNYDDFVSLSTNHLEIGSHVKEQPRSVYDQKKALFTLPLMVPSSSAVNPDQVMNTGLLNIPKESLPLWSDLPVLDLHGALSSSAEIWSRGQERQQELAECTTVAVQGPSRNSFIAEDLFTCAGITSKVADEIENDFVL